ncbi:MAG: alcohol dehydrogenase catalytic domain-containing protein [Pseudomonadota bacterium]
MNLPNTMQALTINAGGFAQEAGIGPYLDAFDPYLSLAECPVPSPGQGQVVVRMRTAAINPSDIHFVKGEYGIPRVAGMVAGFEGCGDVVATGPGADALADKRVAFIGSNTSSGAWAEFALADASSCIPLPPGVRDEDAAGLFVNPLTAVGMVSLAEESGSSSVVLSAGASQLSKLMIGLAADRGLKTIALVRRANQIEKLKDLGCDHPLDVTAADFWEVFPGIIAAEKPRVFLDAVVDARSAKIFFGMPNRTRWVIYGLLDSTPSILDQMGQLIFTGKRIEGFWLTHWLASIDTEIRNRAFATVIEKFSSGTWRTDVAAKIPLSDAPARLPDALGNPNTGKLIFVP